MPANALHELTRLGQSVWYDGIRRALLERGDLARYLDDYAVTGVTSNPTIFERAIAASDDYDGVLQAAIERGVEDPEALFWEVAVGDIGGAADVLRHVHDRSDGEDGFVSLELPPRLTTDTAGSIELAEQLFTHLARPNVMIKVAGSPAGIAALEELVFRGVNVNVTLLFSPQQWATVAEAYTRGLERRLDEGRRLDVASVASFFVSRIDGKANARLPEHLRNRLALASCQLVYTAHDHWLASPRWQRLAEAGARPQRLLWASTSTKDPTLPDTFYVGALAVRDTIDTMDEHTMFAFARAGAIEPQLSQDAGDAEQVAAMAAEAGVDLEQLGRELFDEGDTKFGESFERLLACIGERSARIRSGAAPARSQLGPIEQAVSAVRDELVERAAVRRLWQWDHTLWQNDPTEVADRLGWLRSPEEMHEEVHTLQAFAERAVEDGLTHVLLLGMGGSSLFPLVLSRTFPKGANGLELQVLDSVDPAAIRRVQARLPMERTLVIASSKSGTTTEVTSLLAWFWEHHGDPDRFVVISDPGTPLARLGHDRQMRAVFANRADLGGRYSALSHFGLVPAALAGIDVAELLHRAGRMVTACADCVRPEANPGLTLAALLASAAREGRDKLTLVPDEAIATFGLWIEQLVAESTGKHSVGILPVIGEALGSPEVYGSDRLFVATGGDGAALDSLAAAGHPVLELPLEDPYDLGGEVIRWEIGVALTGAALGINPFDQPDVEAAKHAARRGLQDGVVEPTPEPLEPLLDRLGPGDYLAIQAYVDPEDPVIAKLAQVRQRWRDRYKVATTLGVGPRYLHSTGQLHKGGPANGVFVQVVGEDAEDLPIPGEEFGFAALKRAQAAGDLEALRARGRRVARVRLEELLEVGQ